MMRKVFALLVVAASLAATGAAGAKTATVTITKNGYVPNSVTIAAGDSVQFTNSDAVAHQIRFKSSAGVTCTANPVVLQPGQSVTCTFKQPGTYTYSDPNVKGKTFRGTVVVSGQPAGGSVNLQVAPQLVVFGAKVTLSGALSNHKSGESLQVLAQTCGATSATAAGSVTTTTNGAFSFQPQPLKNTVYTVKSKNSTSNAVTVKVRPRLRLAKLAAPRRFSVRVFAGESFAGKYATFQRYSALVGRWLKVRSVLLRPNSTGVAPTVISSATFKSKVKRRLRVRVVLGQAQVGSCYLIGRSNVIRS
jgi:plastocyanin